MAVVVALVTACCVITSLPAQLLSGPRVTIQPHSGVPNFYTPGANIRVDSNLVLIPVTVTDRKSRFVTGLTRDYFRLFENQQEQTISHFSIEDAPISVGIVFDRSQSMGNKMKPARE